ncbi:MAG: hypothetical protein ABIQ72_16035 [Usitatibacter sp.]
MQRKQAGDFPPEVLKLFDGCVHGGITRRATTTPRRSSRGGARSRSSGDI